MGYVYKITNTVNGKAYIGISIHEPTKDRIKKHLSGQGNRIIARAIKKYGTDAFAYKILEANVFDEILPELEVFYISQFNTVSPHGYNLTHGGDHAVPSEETRQKTSEALKGKRHSEEARRKMSKAQKNRSAETRRKLSEALKGKTRSAETRRKMSEAHRGKKLSDETRRKLSEAGKNRPVSEAARRKLSEANRGRTHSEASRRKMSEDRRGRTHSDETRRKMSEAQKGKTLSAEHRRKISEAQRHVDYVPAHAFFFSLPPDMPLREKRKLLFTTFPSVSKSRIYDWVHKWTSS